MPNGRAKVNSGQTMTSQRLELGRSQRTGLAEENTYGGQEACRTAEPAASEELDDRLSCNHLRRKGSQAD